MTGCMLECRCLQPPCARLVLSGNFSKVAKDSAEFALAYTALTARHPFIKKLPDDHHFYVVRLDLDGIWLIDMYGGPAIIAPSAYFGASMPGFQEPHRPRALTTLPTPPNVPSKPPPVYKKAETARWMARSLTYGFLATTSTRSDGSTPGDAFGNPYGIAEVDGTPYVYGTDMDASFADVFASARGSRRASIALTEASLPGPTLRACKIAHGSNGDPENPPCARLVLSGQMAKLAPNSTEEVRAKTALFARHPSYAQYPSGHGFYVAKLELDGIWLIDIYGGAAIIDPSDYFAA